MIGFDERLDSASSYLDESLNFPLAGESIIKCIALQLGIDPSGDALLSLRHQTPDAMNAAFQHFRDNMFRVSAFTQSWLNIHSSEFIPYEGQLLVLYKAIGLGEASEKAEFERLKAWFWAISFNESLRGKPDHYVTRAVANWRETIFGRLRGLEPRLRLSEADFVERRLIKGEALSTAFAGMFAHSNADSIRSGMDLQPFLYTLDADTSVFHTVVPLGELQRLHMGRGALR